MVLQGHQACPGSADSATLPPMRIKHPTSIRLSPQAKDLLAALAHTLGVSQTAVLELAVRQMAKREGLAPEKPQRQQRARQVTSMS